MTARPVPLHWINSLWRRRVPQGLLLFFGAVWGLVEVTSFLVERYRLTDNIVDMVGLGALLLCPGVLVWMLRQRPDPEDLLDTRDVVIGCGNGLIAVVVVLLLFGGQAIGRATDTVMVENESGAMESREVPRPELLRSLAIAPLKRADTDTTDWLGVAVSQTLQLDLSQNGFIQLAGNEAQFGDTGGQDPGDLSVPRRQAIARAGNAQYFIDGEVSGSPERIRLRATIYRTDPLQALAVVDSEGLDLSTTVDSLTPRISAALELPAERAAGAVDGPVSALLSDNSDAIANLFASEYLLSTRRDLSRGLEHLQDALELDPEFALAGLRVYFLASAIGDVGQMRHGLDVAYENRERVTEDLRCVVRTLHSSLDGKQDLAKRIAKGCVEQFPNNAQTRRLYAEFLRMLDQDLAGAIQQYEAILALGSANDNALLGIAQLRQLSGDEAGAIDAYERYLKLKPADPAATQALASLEIAAGKPDQARERVLDAIARQDTSKDLSFFFATMQLRQGQFDEALSIVSGFLDSDIVSERVLALRMAEMVAEARGEMRKAQDLADQQIALAPPGSEAISRLSRINHYLRWQAGSEDVSSYEPLLDAAIAGTDEVARGSREFYRLLISLHIGSTSDLSRGREALEFMIQKYGRRDLAFLLEVIRARQADLEGNHTTAAKVYAEAYEQHRRAGGNSVLSEFFLLRWWIDAAARAGDIRLGEAADTRLARIQPGYPLSLLARARFAAATGQPENARTLLDRALQLWLEADAGYAPLQAAISLRGQLDQ